MALIWHTLQCIIARTQIQCFLKFIWWLRLYNWVKDALPVWGWWCQTTLKVFCWHVVQCGGTLEKSRIHDKLCQLSHIELYLASQSDPHQTWVWLGITWFPNRPLGMSNFKPTVHWLLKGSCDKASPVDPPLSSVVFASPVQSGFLPPKQATVNCNWSRTDPDIVGPNWTT